MKEVSGLFQEAKLDSGRMDSYQKNLRSSLRFFSTSFGEMPIDEITPELVQGWLKSWPVPSSRNTRLCHVKALFNYALKRRWIESNPCETVDRAIVAEEIPSIFSAADCERILREAPAETIPYFVLCMYGGIRCCEAQRLTWDRVDLDRGVVTIDGKISKTHKTRYVPLPANALAWLRTAKRSGDLIAPSQSTVRRRRQALVKKLGLTWDENVLRHTAGSMYMASGKTSAEISSICSGTAGTFILSTITPCLRRNRPPCFLTFNPSGSPQHRGQALMGGPVIILPILRLFADLRHQGQAALIAFRFESEGDSKGIDDNLLLRNAGNFCGMA